MLVFFVKDANVLTGMILLNSIITLFLKINLTFKKNLKYNDGTFSPIKDNCELTKLWEKMKMEKRTECEIVEDLLFGYVDTSGLCPLQNDLLTM